jgi:large repetitive protein
VHFSFKTLILRVQSTRKISALPPIFASGEGIALATRKNEMLPFAVYLLFQSLQTMSVLISPAVPAQSTPNLLHPVISLVPPTLVVIDATLDGASAFASAVRRDAGQTTVLMLHPSATLRESLTQVAIALHSDPDLQRLVLVAHGEPGAIYFGENALTADSLVHHAGVVSAWDVPEMILCSCQVGVDAHFLEQLAAITASRVVASTDPLGNGVWLPQMWDLFEHSLLQHYSGTLAPKVSQGFRNANTSGTRTPVASRSTSTGDFNGDGNVDLVSTFPGTNRIAIALGDGSAGFTSSTPIDGFILPQAVSVGDFNGDSQPDLAIATYDRAVVVLLGNSSGGFIDTPQG